MIRNVLKRRREMHTAQLRLSDHSDRRIFHRDLIMHKESQIDQQKQYSNMKVWHEANNLTQKSCLCSGIWNWIDIWFGELDRFSLV